MLLPAFAVASTSTYPKPAAASMKLPPLVHEPAGRGLRAVPAFTAGSDTESAVKNGALLTDERAMVGALDRQSQVVFGSADDHGLAAYAGAYNFSKAPVDPILDAALGTGAVSAAQVPELNDLAGLLVLAAVEFPLQFPSGALAAYGLYDRARQTHGCDAQLNLAFLVSTDKVLNEPLIEKEFRQAAEDCPGDPTPLWLLGQVQSARGGSAGATFTQLEHRFPGSAAGWSGEADALMRDAYRIDVAAPFTARADYLNARVLYQRAEMLDADPGLVAGDARALAGLGKYRAAATAQRRALEHAGNAAVLQVRLVDYLERADDFATAAQVGGGFLRSVASSPHGPSLIALGDGARNNNVFDKGLSDEDALGPLSLGAARILPVQLDAVPVAPGGPVGATPLFTSAATDYSFIPQFRAFLELTGNPGWCRELAHTRDLVVSGHAPAALRHFPTAFVTTAPGPGGATAVTCAQGTVLRAVALYESGHRQDAIAALEHRADGIPENSFASIAAAPSATPLTLLMDADQNMWRYAAKLGKAATVAEHLSAADPADPIGPDRAGEIAFLRGRFRTAAAHFREAVARASTPRFWMTAGNVSSEVLANELLKQGTALERAGDLGHARMLLRDADAIAVPATLVRLYSFAPILDSYNARLQAGDTELRAHHYRSAGNSYRAARSAPRSCPTPIRTVSRPRGASSSTEPRCSRTTRPSCSSSATTARRRWCWPRPRSPPTRPTRSSGATRPRSTRTSGSAPPPARTTAPHSGPTRRRSRTPTTSG